MRVVKKYRGLGLQTINNKPCKTCGVGKIHRVEEVPVSNVTTVKARKGTKTSSRLWNHERAGLG